MPPTTFGAGDLGRLVVRIGADPTELNREFAKAEESVQGFSSGMNKALGAISFAAVAIGFAKLTQSAIDYGEQLHRLSAQSGMTAAEIAKLRFAAEQSDTSIEGLMSSVRILTRNMQEAASGSKEAETLFRSFHVEFRNADGTLRNYRDVLLEVADRIRNTGDQTLILAQGQKLLGRGFTEVLPLLRQGSEGIAELERVFEKIAPSDEVVNDFARKADDIKDAINGIKQAAINATIAVLDFFLTTRREEEAAAEVSKAHLEALRQSPDMALFLQRQRASGTEFATQGGASLGALAARDALFRGPPQEFQQPRPQEIERPSLGALAAENPQLRAPEDFFKGGLDQAMQKSSEDMKKFNQSFLDMSKNISQAWQATVTQFAAGFGNAMAQMIVHGASFKDAIKQFWVDMATTIIQLIGQMIAKWLVFLALKALGAPATGGASLFLREGGVALSARAGLVHAQRGVVMTPGFGERGIPVMAHPNELISPIDKLLDMVKSIRGDTQINVYEAGDARATAELVAFELDRKRRAPA